MTFCGGFVFHQRAQCSFHPVVVVRLLQLDIGNNGWMMVVVTAAHNR